MIWFQLKPEDERLSSLENEVTFSVTNDDHGSAVRNGGLVEELVLSEQNDERSSQGTVELDKLRGKTYLTVQLISAQLQSSFL